VRSYIGGGRFRFLGSTLKKQQLYSHVNARPPDPGTLH